MTEYIRKQDAVNSVECANGNITWAERDDCKKRLEELPPADVAPVVHGKYVGEYDGYADGNPVCDMWYCSVCGCCFEDWDEKPTYNFCPNCGAKMDGGEKHG